MAFLLLLYTLLLGCSQREDPFPKDIPEGSSLDIVAAAREAGFTLHRISPSEQSVLRILLPEERQQFIRSAVLQRDGDRTAAIFWYRNPEVEQHMQILTEYLFDQFSSEMTNLIDEAVKRREGFDRIDVLAFTDPMLSEERFVFAQIRDQLYEFHVSEEKEEWVQGLLLEIARIEN